MKDNIRMIDLDENTSMLSIPNNIDLNDPVVIKARELIKKSAPKLLDSFEMGLQKRVNQS